MDRLELQRAIRNIGLKPQRAAGQHFLFDEGVVARMVEAAGVGPKDTVLEIGPGFGVLTKRLLSTGANVIAVELDRRLHAWLAKKYSAESRLRLIHGDVFRVRLDQVVRDFSYKLVANLPYSATSLTFRNFLEQAPRPTDMVTLVQKEVAERITAKPGAMSLLSLAVQYVSKPEFLFTVPRTSFLPPPDVTSAVIACRDVADRPRTEREALFRIARAGFSAKRKQFQNSLAASLRLPRECIADLLLQAGIAPEIRPQELSVEDWQRLIVIFGKVIHRVG